MQPPLLTGDIAAAVFFLPMKEGRAARHGDCGQQVTGVGQEVGGFGHTRGVDMQIVVVHCRRAQHLGKLSGGAVALRQLIGAEEKVCDRQTSTLRQHMGLQVDA